MGVAYRGVFKAEAKGWDRDGGGGVRGVWGARDEGRRGGRC